MNEQMRDADIRDLYIGLMAQALLISHPDRIYTIDGVSVIAVRAVELAGELMKARKGAS